MQGTSSGKYRLDQMLNLFTWLAGLLSSCVMERLVVVRMKLMRTKRRAARVLASSTGSLVSALRGGGREISIFTADPFLIWREIISKLALL